MERVTLPELGEGIEKATVASWHLKEGEPVKEGQDIVEMVTDKASFNVSAPRDGVLKEILVQEGRDADIGEALAVIE